MLGQGLLKVHFACKQAGSLARSAPEKKGVCFGENAFRRAQRAQNCAVMIDRKDSLGISIDPRDLNFRFKSQQIVWISVNTLVVSVDSQISIDLQDFSRPLDFSRFSRPFEISVDPRISIDSQISVTLRDFSRLSNLSRNSDFQQTLGFHQTPKFQQTFKISVDSQISVDPRDFSRQNSVDPRDCRPFEISVEPRISLDFQISIDPRAVIY